MKYDLDRTGMKKRDKNGKNFMHWNVAPDAVDLQQMNRWLNNCNVHAQWVKVGKGREQTSNCSVHESSS